MPTVTCPACGAWHVDVDGDGNIRRHPHRSGVGFCTGVTQQSEPAPEPVLHALPYDKQKRQGSDFPRGVCPVCKRNYGLNEDNTMRSHPPCPGSGERSLFLPDETEA